MANPAFFGSLTIDADNDTIVVDGATDALTHGEYFIHSLETLPSLLDTIVVACAAHGRSIAYAISTDGVLTISSPTAFSLSLDVITTLGYTAALSGSSSYIATNKLQYCWFPTRFKQGTAPTIGSRHAIVNQVETADGTVYTSKLGEFAPRTVIECDFVPMARVWNQANDNASLEEFWQTTYSEGRKVIFWHDYGPSETQYAYVPDLSSKTDLVPTRSIPGYDGLWNVALPFKGVVE